MKKAIVLLALVSIGYAAFAQEQIPINNPSFESPQLETGTYTVGEGIPDWIVSGGTAVGVWNVGQANLVPDGNQIGYINGTGATTTAISQTLSTVLEPESTYNLSIDVGSLIGGYNPGTGYSVSLYAGGNLLTSVTPVPLAFESWTTLDASYTSGASVPSNANLEVVITDTSVGQLDFDNVILIDPPAVPDGGSTAMLCGMGLVALGWMRRKLA